MPPTGCPRGAIWGPEVLHPCPGVSHPCPRRSPIPVPAQRSPLRGRRRHSRAKMSQNGVQNDQNGAKWAKMCQGLSGRGPICPGVGGPGGVSPGLRTVLQGRIVGSRGRGDPGPGAAVAGPGRARAPGTRERIKVSASTVGALPAGLLLNSREPPPRSRCRHDRGGTRSRGPPHPALELPGPARPGRPCSPRPGLFYH